MSSQIAAWFVPTILPEGNEPAIVQQQYLHVAFPVREHNVRHEGTWTIIDTVDCCMGRYDAARVVIVDALDAIKALMLSNNKGAAKWLIRHYGASGLNLGQSFLIFEREKGRLYSPQEIVYQSPETADFDEISA